MTVFEPRGDKAYVDGFYFEKVKGDATRCEGTYGLPADHQRARPVEMVRQPEVVSHGPFVLTFPTRTSSCLERT